MKKSVPLALAFLLAGGVLYLVHSCGSEPEHEAVPRVIEAMTRVSLPGGVDISVPEGSFNFKLAQFLADSNDQTVPRKFVFDHLNFESASTQITPESKQTMKDLVSILKAYPAVNLKLEGYTDNEGAMEANKMLSWKRADAIRDSLAASGVDAKHVETAGWGAERPVASNDTAEGRAQNRRLEMTVTSK